MGTEQNWANKKKKKCIKTAVYSYDSFNYEVHKVPYPKNLSKKIETLLLKLKGFSQNFA